MIRWFVTTGSRLWVPVGRWARLTHAQEGSHGWIRSFVFAEDLDLACSYARNA
jgi:hypothetical protein